MNQTAERRKLSYQEFPATCEPCWGPIEQAWYRDFLFRLVDHPEETVDQEMIQELVTHLMKRFPLLNEAMQNVCRQLMKVDFLLTLQAEVAEACGRRVDVAVETAHRIITGQELRS